MLGEKLSRISLTLTALTIAVGLVLVPTASGKGKPGGGGGSSNCTQSAPGIAVENNWAWGQTGSW
mgnify:CR=1 FL=1